MSAHDEMHHGEMHHGENHGEMHGEMHGAMHGMSMAFHFGFEETILFSAWRITDLYGLVGSAVGIVIMGMIYEGLKNYREFLNINDALNNRNETPSKCKAMFTPMHFLQTFLQAIQVTLGYFLMFIFMTYNVYLCIAVILGSTLGYFMFSWKNARIDITECCS